MNKHILLGMGIFLTILLSILSLSTTADVNAQIILNDDTNGSVSEIYYQLDFSELNLTNEYNLSYDTETNITEITNITHAIDYECNLRIESDIYSSPTYTLIGYTLDLNETLSFNQTLNESLSDYYYDLLLECLYYINTTNIVSEIKGEIINESMNITLNDTANNTLNTSLNETIINMTLILSSMNITESKRILVDSTAPVIEIYNSTLILNNDTVYLDLTITDLSDIYCTVATSVQNISFNATNISDITVTDVSIPLSLPIGNHTVSILCTDKLYNANNIIHTISVLNIENLTNTTNSTNTTNNNTNSTITPYFELTISKPEYGLGEIGYYTINATNGSNVSITICPFSSGWVQCYMTPTFVNESYPKTQAMPYTNKTGIYIIEGVMHYDNTTIIRNATYDTKNTLTATITASKTQGVVGDTITFNATANSGIAPYVYKWTMHDNTKFTGMGAYKTYNAAGTYRVNLTVNDSSGNNYSTSIDVTIKNKYVLTVIVADDKKNTRLSNATVRLGSDLLQTNSNGIATFTMAQDTYRLKISKDNYETYSDDINLDSTRTLFINLSFVDLIPPKITLMTANDVILSPSTVDLKFKAEDTSNVACSLYVAELNSSWYSLKDSGDNLLVNTVYTFELRNLTLGEYKWKVECSDVDGNKAYSDEREFAVSDGSVTTALQASSQSVDYLNKALDNIDKLSGDESEVADILGIRKDLKYLLDKINNLERDMHDLNYRRDLDENGKIEAQKNLTTQLNYLENNTPVSLSIKDTKTFVKYVRDEDLQSLLEEYSDIKNMKVDKKLLLESTKRMQSKVIISTRVRNVDLYYLDGKTQTITLVIKDIDAATPEDEQSIRGSNTITFTEVIPKSICQTAKDMVLLNKDYTILKDDPIIEYPSDTESIVYYIPEKINVEKFQDTDTVLIEKNINTVKSTTGMSIFDIDTLSSVRLDGRGVMIIIIVILILFYLVMNFDVIDKIRHMHIRFLGGSKKRISFIKVLVNDALDYLKAEDYDKAALIYHEIKLSYEEADEYVRAQVYDESFDLCNQLDLAYAMKVLERVDQYIKIQDKNKAISEFEKLENTYNKLSEPYQAQIADKFKKATGMIRT